MTRLGMFAHPDMIAARSVIFGMHSAIRAGTRAIFERSRAKEVRLVCSPPAKQMILDEVAQATRGRVGGPAISVSMLHEFLDAPVDLPDAWFEIGGDTTRPHRFRRRVGGDYPIAVVHHSASYGYCLHQWFLPLLLGDVRANDTIICTSKSSRDVIRNTLQSVAESMNREHGTHLAYRGRLDLVPLGIDVEHFKPVPRAEARAAFGVDPVYEVLLWLGRFSAQDKADLIPLLRVFKRVAAGRRSRARLYLVGSSRPGEAQVVAAAIDRLGLRGQVVALPPVSDAQLPALYSMADVFVSPVDSVQEMFGLTVLEAMACGTPVVCSDWGGYRDSVVDGVTGYLVPTLMPSTSDEADDFGEWSLPFGELTDQFAHAQSVAVDLEAMERAIVRVLDQTPEQREEMGAAARARAVEYAWPSVVRRYDDLFTDLRSEEAVAGPSARPYSRPGFARTFSHYPTSVVGDDAVIERVGSARIDDCDPWRMGIVQPLLCQSLSDLLDRPQRLGDLVAVTGAPADRTRRHVLWLIKHGFAKVRMEGRS